MDAQKPEALTIDGRPFFSLESYDPVECEIVLSTVSDAEVELAIEHMAAAAGGTMADMQDSAWVAAHFEGATDVDFLRSEVRAQFSLMNREATEAQKAEKCTAALAARLRQRVPAERVAELRASAEAAFREQLAYEGVSLEVMLAQTGGSMDEVNAMFESQAQRMAEEDAALEAYAAQMKIRVTDEEIVECLGLDMAHMQDPSQPDGLGIVRQARQLGRYDELRIPAIRSKALSAAMAEARFTYRNETEAEAAARLEHLRRAYAARLGDAGNADADEKGDGPRLRLV